MDSDERTAYSDAISSLIDAAKLDFAAALAPLAVISSQLSSIIQMQSIVLKIALSILIVTFDFCSLRAWAYLKMLRGLLVVENLSISEARSGKGAKIKGLFDLKSKGLDYTVDEETLVVWMRDQKMVTELILKLSWSILVLVLLYAVWI